jgi:transmembrane sensor
MYPVVNDDELDAAAAAWTVRLDRGELNEHERRALDEWLAASPRHLGAFVRAQAIWTDADRIGAMGSARPIAAASPPQPRRFAYRARALLTASAAAFVLAVGTVTYLHLAGREGTHFGEIRRLTLPDGSTLVLNAESTVQIRFEKNERRVLLRAGEASFQVAHDVNRPFIVEARDVAVRAVGTSFTVRLQPASVSVTVVEGVVEVKRPTETKVEEVTVIGHNRSLVAQTSRPMAAVPLTDEQITRDMAWQEGLLMFEGESLAQAVVQVNRYSPTPVIIDNDRLAQRAFVGVFRIGDAHAFVNAAAAAFAARVNEKADGLHLAE